MQPLLKKKQMFDTRMWVRVSGLSNHDLGKTTKVLCLLTNVILTVYFLNPLGSHISRITRQLRIWFS